MYRQLYVIFISYAISHNFIYTQEDNVKKLNTSTNYQSTQITSLITKNQNDVKNLKTYTTSQLKELKSLIATINGKLLLLERSMKELIHDNIATMERKMESKINWLEKLLNNTTTNITDDLYNQNTLVSGIQNKFRTPPCSARWNTTAVTVAHQLNWPFGLFVDDDQTVYIADHDNHSVMAWKANATTGEVLAGGKGKGNRLDQLNKPTDVIVDRKTSNLLICDQGNQRVVRWPHQSHRSNTTSKSQGEIVIDNITCYGLIKDDQDALYVSDGKKHEVRRYDKDGDKKGIVVAGGHGRGAGLNQLSGPTYLFVDARSTLYVSDYSNHRVMKWMKGATEGIVVAGGNGWGTDLTRLSLPLGVWANECGHVYVADQSNHRVMRWEKGAKEGTVIAGGNEYGAAMNQLSGPEGLFLDRHGHLYVVDHGNHRVQRFSLLDE